MASIKISELRPVGSELFQDSESFLNELNNSHEADHILGGGFYIAISLSAQSAVGNSVNANTLLNVNTVVIAGGR